MRLCLYEPNRVYFHNNMDECPDIEFFADGLGLHLVFDMKKPNEEPLVRMEILMSEMNSSYPKIRITITDSFLYEKHFTLEELLEYDAKLHLSSSFNFTTLFTSSHRPLDQFVHSSVYPRETVWKTFCDVRSLLLELDRAIVKTLSE